MSDPNCARCGSDRMERLTVSGGGQVGWFCEECHALYAEGNYIDVMRKNLSAEGEYHTL